MIFFIKNLGITICCIFYYMKLLNLTTPKYFLTRSSIFSVLLAASSIYSELYYPYYTIPLLIIFIMIFLNFNIRIPLTVSITATSIAFVLSNFTLLISSIITGTFFINLYNSNHVIFVQVLSCLFQLAIMPLPFHIKRCKKGMPFLFKESYAFSGMLISFFTLLIITASIYMQTNNLKIFLLFSLILLCFLIFNIYHYWQTNITKTYQDKLKERELEELQERNAKLEQEVIRLGKIVHKDNSIIPEYAYILRTFLTTNTISEKDTIYNGKTLLEKLDKLTEERKGIVHQQDIHCQQLPSTKVFGIDSLLAFKQQKAFKENIDLQACFSCDIAYLVEEIISEDDLHTLLTYLLDNAIIANKHKNGRHIMLNISIIENVYHINVLDSGIPFTANVIAKWGFEQITTHKNDGGNGIGMMTIYEILKKYNASFIINEIPSSNHTYTKNLTISFDNMNQYILQTNRPNTELSMLSHRTDLKIIKQ